MFEETERGKVNSMCGQEFIISTLCSSKVQKGTAQLRIFQKEFCLVSLFQSGEKALTK